MRCKFNPRRIGSTAGIFISPFRQVRVIYQLIWNSLRCKITALLETCVSIQQTKETRMDSATVSPSAQSRCSHGPVRNKSRCVPPTCQKIPVCIIHTCSLHVFKAGLAGFIRDCTRYRRPVTRPFSMDLARDPSDRSDPLYEWSREDHHAQIADCTLTFPISH